LTAILDKNVILEQTFDENLRCIYPQTAVSELTGMKTSRFLAETSYPDVPGGILSPSHLSFLPVVRSAARLYQMAQFYFKSITYYLYRFCYVIYHRLQHAISLSGQHVARILVALSADSFLPSGRCRSD
jgi:hypothetical protein